jgi:outer membrane protein OmpA-like peptidoglycan-associated protein
MVDVDSAAARRRSRSVVPAWVVVAMLGLVPSVARADLPERSLSVGAVFGLTVAPDDWDLHEIADAGVATALVAPGGGLRVSGTFAYWLTLEGNLLLYSVSSPTSANLALSFTGDALVNLVPSGDWVPFASVGAGLYQSLSSDLGEDADWRVGAGLGLRGLVTDWMIVRADAKWVMTDGATGDQLAHNAEVLLSADFIVWQPAVSLPDTDWDDDGVDNEADRCPREVGHGSGLGCPDSDGDTVVDSEDRCPAAGGSAGLAGCPDRDGDGVADIDDRCPDDAGGPGSSGCSDRDGDGLTDAEDACPDEAGKKQAKGCPDSDGDGLIDKRDLCPDIPGTVEHQGCVPKQPLNLGLIAFRHKTSELTDDAMRALDRIGAALQERPDVRIRIIGHTDSLGKERNNVHLSQERAVAVRTYLNEKGGVALERMETEGRGSAEPRGSNRTSEGRAQNRRIEFEVLP